MVYDLVVIGAGPGGYVAAIKASQLGLKVAVVEKRSTFGGTCLNVGCIPSKALLHATGMFYEASHSFESLGIRIGKPCVDLKKMMEHKEKTVSENVRGIGFLFRKNKIDSFQGIGSIAAPGKVLVTDSKGHVSEISTRNIVIATGSEISGIPGVALAIDEKVIVSSTGAMCLPKVPEEMIVVGAGAIGLELGSVWSRLGARVTVLEYQDTILKGADGELSSSLEKILMEQGMSFICGVKVTSVEKKGQKATVSLEYRKDGKSQTISADVALIAAGRKPFTTDLDPSSSLFAMEGDRIQVDDFCRTSIPGIYAIGDVVRGPMLAHKAEDEGVAVAEALCGKSMPVYHAVMPSVVYTAPEVAWVGKTSEQLGAEGIAFRTGSFPFSANGRARAGLHTRGFVKILAEEKTDRVLGGHILATGASEMIHEIAVLMEFGGASEDLARTCHAHPTLSEAVREAAWAAFSKPIHL